ncbi:hypothetical protein WN944_001162 [Citrus x changshan-huyou]|uniref:J domain-containing protein n=1 Tax=Citrus x changshan-huyou TaxID=2935761 RepID=A0AAP0MIQ2_9ROSI
MPVMALGTRGSLYEVLRVEPTTMISKIKTAYRSLAKVYHLDFSGNGRDFIQIHNAYETLSDPTAMVVYDMSLVSRRRTRTTSFGWVNAPPCDGCSNKTIGQGMGTPFPSEIQYRATRVELFRLNNLKLEMDREELIEHETALYDRQVRVWGADAQRRVLSEDDIVAGIFTGSLARNLIVGVLNIFENFVGQLSLVAGILIAFLRV